MSQEVCSNCGKAIAESEFCLHCGMPLTEQAKKSKGQQDYDFEYIPGEGLR